MAVNLKGDPLGNNSINWTLLNLYLLGGLEHGFYFSIYRNHQPDNYWKEIMYYSSVPVILFAASRSVPKFPGRIPPKIPRPKGELKAGQLFEVKKQVWFSKKTSMKLAYLRGKSTGSWWLDFQHVPLPVLGHWGWFQDSVEFQEGYSNSLLAAGIFCCLFCFLPAMMMNYLTNRHQRNRLWYLSP